MSGKKILIVDDEPHLVRVLKDRLTVQGYEVLTAADGTEGLNNARVEKPDLILLDLMLPHISGLEICRLLKFDEQYKKIPIIMLTARASLKDVESAKEAGADTYLIKPVNFDELSITLDKYLKK